MDVLQKVIRSEDDPSVIEKIEFNSIDKFIRKFEKRQQKCKFKIQRQKKVGLRDKIL